MLKRLRNFLKASPDGTGREVSKILQNDHPISNYDISRSARKVISQLKAAGYSAYLVGGGVRDLLLDGQPKDFDVATDATPEQVNKIFKGSRIIGRRFRIVHVRFGREIIEVTTFRGHHSEARKRGEASQSDKGILLRDNVYGDIRSDALRRDFTVNALYFDIEEGAVLDFTGGVDDLDKRQLRMIGDPETRYKEDPVRLLRAVRFSAKLGFAIEAKTEQPMREHAEYLSEVPPARRFEEVLKLFLCGSATAIITKLHEYGLLAYLFPAADDILEHGSELDKRFIFSVASNTDKRIRQNKSVTPAFIYAAMLWPSLRLEMDRLMEEQKFNEYDALQQASQGVISQQLAVTAIPKRFLIPMREIWSLQLRLKRREGKRAAMLMEHPRFRAGYDFLLMREQAGEKLDGLGLWWTKFQSGNEDAQSEMVQELNNNGQAKRSRKPRRRKKPNNKSDSDNQNQ